MLKETVLEEGKASALGVSEDMKEFYTLQEPLIGKIVLSFRCDCKSVQMYDCYAMQFLCCIA